MVAQFRRLVPSKWTGTSVYVVTFYVCIFSCPVLIDLLVSSFDRSLSGHGPHKDFSQ